MKPEIIVKQWLNDGANSFGYPKSEIEHLIKEVVVFSKLKKWLCDGGIVIDSIASIETQVLEQIEAFERET